MVSATTIAAVFLCIFVFGWKQSPVTAVEYRLSKDVFPLSYDIKITPYFLPEDGEKRFTFRGATTITINANGSGVREFAVHADYLQFEEINMRLNGARDIQFTTEYESITDKLIFRLEEDIQPSVNYLLYFKYTGRISDGYDGFYRINYTDAEGIEKWMVATQLQRIDARKLFPCFDEPQFKAHFHIHISRPKTFKSFSNTRILTTTIDDTETDRYVDHFEETPSMSTYLVAMIVSEFTARGDNNLFILARPEYYNKTIFSYEVSKNIVQLYDELFGVQYIDLGIPVLKKASLSKFIHNGMENWGLMIYKDEVLIFEEDKTDFSGKEYTITIIAHETSHSWFGDSITFEWWGYFWLNEGFARYYQYYATHMIYPEYELDKQFIVNQLHYILNIDAVNSTQPLSEPHVASPSELARKFSGITYVKGASIIRMISHAMSEERFRKAVKEYVKENLGGSVAPSHLLKHLKANWPSTPAVNVDEFFSDWTEQVGFPLLRVTASDRTVTVEQERYLLNPNDGSDADLRYTIPLTYTTSVEGNFSSTYPRVYLARDQSKMTLDFAENIDWVVFNIQQSSYYRVIYDTNLWAKLKYALLQENWSGIHELNRAQMVDDLLAFAKADIVKYDFVFGWLEYLETETAYIPWEAAFTGFAFISDYLTLEEHVDFGKYILSITETVFQKLGTSIRTNDTVLDIYNRKKVVNYNCKYGHSSCSSEVQKTLRDYLNLGTAIPVDMRSTVFCSGMRDGSEDDFDKLHKRFSEETVTREKLRMRSGLGCVRGSKNVEKYLDFVLSDGVPFDEKETALKPLYEQNPENVWPVYGLITSRLEEVVAVLGSWSRTATVISRIVNLFTTVEQRDAYEEFVKANEDKFGASSTTLYAALQALDSKFEWTASHLEPLRVYFKSRNGGVSATRSSLFALGLALLLHYFK